MKFTRLLLPLLTVAPLLSAQAYNDRSSRGGMDNEHLLPAAAGISSPGEVLSLGENPAGLSYNRDFKLAGELTSGNNQFNPLGFGGGFFVGNGSAGGGVILQGANSTTNGVSTSINTLAFGINNGVDDFAGGIAYDPASSATLALDADYNRVGQTTILEPGITVHFPVVHIMGAYGFRIQGSGGNRLANDLTLGLGIPLGRMIALQAYYMGPSSYSAILTISF